MHQPAWAISRTANEDYPGLGFVYEDYIADELGYFTWATWIPMLYIHRGSVTNCASYFYRTLQVFWAFEKGLSTSNYCLPHARTRTWLVNDISNCW